MFMVTALIIVSTFPKWVPFTTLFSFKSKKCRKEPDPVRDVILGQILSDAWGRVSGSFIVMKDPVLACPHF